MINVYSWDLYYALYKPIEYKVNYSQVYQQLV